MPQRHSAMIGRRKCDHAFLAVSSVEQHEMLQHLVFEDVLEP